MRIRTAYSFKKAVGDLDSVFNRLKKCKYPAFPITDTESTYGFRKWNDLCKNNNVKPVFGVELAVTEKFGQGKEAVFSYWTFVSRNDISKINDLVTIATSSPEKVPCLLYNQLPEILKGDIIAICGNFFDFEKYKKLSQHKDVHFSLSPSTSKFFYHTCKEHKVKFCASSDNVFCNKEDENLYRSALGRKAFVQTYDQYILDNNEFKKALSFVSDSDLKKSISNRNKLLKECNAELKQGVFLKPKEKKTLKELCEIRAKKIGVDLNDQVYKTRLEYELKLIEEKDFVDYFIIIEDLVSFAKTKMLVGPARGSSCGSLVCYLLGITTIDPIKYDLIFERFIDVNRQDLPDIDIDFSDHHRHLVFEYMVKKYGVNRVAKLGTVSMFQPRSALKEVCKSLDIPPWEPETALEDLIEYHVGDSKAKSQLEDTLKTTDKGQKFLEKYPEAIIACKLEGQPSHGSRHAAGIIVTDGNVNEVVAIDARTRSSMCDKKDAEKLGLLKIDALGLKQLSVFERCLELMGEKIDNYYLETIPLNDQKAFDILNKGHYSGVFQFKGKAVQNLANEIKFTHIEDMVAITSLARPGPLNSGDAGIWVRRKNGKQAIDVLHSKLLTYLENTYGVITYQEQVMKIVKELGGLSWGDTSEVRRGMGKTLGEEFLNKYKEKFVKGCVKNDIKKETAALIWSKIMTFGAYAFNRSHAVAYAIMSYYCCYFKAHYPLEFAAASLDIDRNPANQIKLLKELDKEGYSYKPFDLKISTNHWEIDRKNHLLVGPLSNIHGVGPATEFEIIEARNNGEELRPNLQKRLNNATSKIETITPIKDAIKRAIPDMVAAGIHTTPTPIDGINPKRQETILLLGLIKNIRQKDENDPEIIEKRGFKYKGPDQAINMFLSDDNGEIFCKIDRYLFPKIGQNMLQTAKAGSSLYAIKGEVILTKTNFLMINVKRVKYLGEMETV